MINKIAQTRPVRILVADDNSDDLVMLREAFRQEPIPAELHAVANDDELLAFLHRADAYIQMKRPHVVLLDIDLPDRGGLATLVKLKADSTFLALPVVLIGTSRDSADVRQAYAAGACGYIAKPLTFDALAEIVHVFVSYWSLVSLVPEG